MGLDLITKAEYKAYAGVSSTNQDAQIDIIIPKVSELVKSICNRTFVDYVNDAKVEYFDGGWPVYNPAEYPVLDIASLEYSSDFGATYTPLVHFTDYVLSKRDDSIRPINRDVFPSTINAYRLTYTAGYEVLPPDLKLAVLDLVKYYLSNEMAIHSNRAPGSNSIQIQYVTNSDLPAHISRVLNLYTNGCF